MRVFGMTGGIACGKSTVAEFFQGAGVPVVDADKLCHKLLQPGTTTYYTVVKLLGSLVLTPTGDLDRKQIGQRIFSDPLLKARYEDLLHPAIQQAFRIEAEKLFAHGYSTVCYDAALLVETGACEQFRPLVVVVCPELDQVSRLMSRNNLTQEEAVIRISAQSSTAEKILKSDFIIDNNSTLEELGLRSRATLLRVLRRLSETRSGASL